MMSAGARRLYRAEVDKHFSIVSGFVIELSSNNVIITICGTCATIALSIGVNIHGTGVNVWILFLFICRSCIREGSESVGDLSR